MCLTGTALAMNKPSRGGTKLEEEAAANTTWGVLGFGVSTTGKNAVTRQKKMKGVGGDVFVFNQNDLHTASQKIGC